MHLVGQPGLGDLRLLPSAEAAVPLLPAPAIGAPVEIHDDIPVRRLAAVLRCTHPLVDVTLHDERPRSGGHGNAEPLQQSGHWHEQPAAQVPRRQFTTPGGLVGGAPAEAEKASGLLDRNGDSALECGQRRIEGRNLGQVGTSL